MDWNPTINRYSSGMTGVARRPFFAAIFTCIITVMHYDAGMTAHVAQPNRENSAAPRITITLPPEHYRQIVQQAKSKRVSASWIVRDAVEKYLAADIPLFSNNERRTS
jgi:hypothetical protein